jgi:hypothetical protein
MVASQFATWTRLAKEANISIIVLRAGLSFTEAAISTRAQAAMRWRALAGARTRG